MVGVLLWDRHISFPEADVKAKQMRGVRRARYDALQSLLCVSNEGRIICKEKVPDEPLLSLGEGL